MPAALRAGPARAESGLSLVELLIAVAILGVLAYGIASLMGTMTRRSQETRVRSEITAELASLGKLTRRLVTRSRNGNASTGVATTFTFNGCAANGYCSQVVFQEKVVGVVRWVTIQSVCAANAADYAGVPVNTTMATCGAGGPVSCPNGQHPRAQVIRTGMPTITVPANPHAAGPSTGRFVAAAICFRRDMAGPVVQNLDVRLEGAAFFRDPIRVITANDGWRVRLLDPASDFQVH